MVKMGFFVFVMSMSIRFHYGAVILKSCNTLYISGYRDSPQRQAIATGPVLDHGLR